MPAIIFKEFWQMSTPLYLNNSISYTPKIIIAIQLFTFIGVIVFYGNYHLNFCTAVLKA